MDTRRDDGVSILIPYSGPLKEAGKQDIFVYLRPESNGVEVESTIFKVIEKNPAYKDGIWLIYMANLSGSWMVRRRVIEHHYALKLYFATHGKEALTPGIRRGFERCYRLPFDDAEVIGSFEAMRRLKCSAEDLFQTWVPADDFCQVCGQTFKRIENLVVVNYDIPALLHKNNAESDIAVMLFRISTGFDYFDELVGEIRDALVQKELLSPEKHESRVFHISKSPFEQILDAEGHLVSRDGETYPLEEISFSRFLLEKGVEERAIRSLVRQPLITIQGTNELGEPLTLPEAERHLYEWTTGDSYEVAYRKLNRIRSQYDLEL